MVSFGFPSNQTIQEFPPSGPFTILAVTRSADDGPRDSQGPCKRCLDDHPKPPHSVKRCFINAPVSAELRHFGDHAY